jgi:starch phosphorylase
VNNDTDVAGRLKVVFIPDFNVKHAHAIYPAADLSEQISTAGKEASGTGNMKFSMNGALTIGTLDGANIEIRDAVGADNFFLFGLTAEEVRTMKRDGYQPSRFVEANDDLKAVLEMLYSGEFSRRDPGLFRPLVDSLRYHDDYMLMADYASYIECQDRVDAAYRDSMNWTRMSVLNVARIGGFSSDRSIREYAEKIWGVKPVRISLEK